MAGFLEQFLRCVTGFKQHGRVLSAAAAAGAKLRLQMCVTGFYKHGRPVRAAAAAGAKELRF